MVQQVRDRRAERHVATRDEIVTAAWQLAREEGLTAFTLRQVAEAVGMRAPSLYSYFESKTDIYDAMFEQANTELLARARTLDPGSEVRTALLRVLRLFVEFCIEDPVRYQLLFQRTIPGFDPSPQAYAPAVEVLEETRRRFAALGLRQQRHLDLWTALTVGLVSQQLANEPGGRRWTRLGDDVVDMYLAHTERDRT